MRRRVTFFQAFYNFARPHQSLRLPLPEAEQILSGIIHPQVDPENTGVWLPTLPDHAWSFRELLIMRFEPIQNQSTSG